MDRCCADRSGADRWGIGPEGGYSLLELVFVVAILLILLGISGPRLLNTSSRVAVLNARSRVSSAVSLARSTSARYGRTSFVVLDVATDRIRVQVDTATVPGQPPVSVHEVDLWRELGVNLRASHPLLCFDPRGLSVAAGTCPGMAVVVRLERGPTSDSVVVSSTGRVSR